MPKIFVFAVAITFFLFFPPQVFADSAIVINEFYALGGSENPPSKFKGAGLLSGTGLALIGVSFALYLWYSKRLSKNENP